MAWPKFVLALEKPFQKAPIASNIAANALWWALGWLGQRAMSWTTDTFFLVGMAGTSALTGLIAGALARSKKPSPSAAETLEPDPRVVHELRKVRTAFANERDRAIAAEADRDEWKKKAEHLAQCRSEESERSIEALRIERDGAKQELERAHTSYREIQAERDAARRDHGIILEMYKDQEANVEQLATQTVNQDERYEDLKRKFREWAGKFERNRSDLRALVRKHLDYPRLYVAGELNPGEEPILNFYEWRREFESALDEVLRPEGMDYFVRILDGIVEHTTELGHRDRFLSAIKELPDCVDKSTAIWFRQTTDPKNPN